MDMFGCIGWVRMCSDTFGYISIENFMIQVAANIDLSESTFVRNFPEAPVNLQLNLTGTFNRDDKNLKKKRN